LRARADGVGDLRGGWRVGWPFLAALTFVSSGEVAIGATEEDRLSAEDGPGIVELTVVDEAAGVGTGLCTGKVRAGRAICGSDGEHDGAGDGETDGAGE